MFLVFSSDKTTRKREVNFRYVVLSIIIRCVVVAKSNIIRPSQESEFESGNIPPSIKSLYSTGVRKTNHCVIIVIITESNRIESNKSRYDIKCDMCN